MSSYFDDDDTSLPGWARPLGKQGYRSFLSLIEGYFANRNIAVAIDDEEGLVKPDLGNFAYSSTFGLQNIAQICQQADRDEWRDLIAAHFDSIFEAKDEDNALHIHMEDFGKLKSQLRSRLYPVDIVNHATEIIQRPGPEGTLEVLALDLPTTVRTVSRSEADVWGLDPDDLFMIGRQNLKAKGLLRPNTVQLEQGTTLTVYTGDPFYAASHVLIIENYLPTDAAHGVLIGVPKRDILIVHRIQNIGAMEAAGAMLQVIVGMHRDGPGSISPYLYWYHDDDFTVLPYELEDQSLKFVPPDDFAELLEELEEHASYS
ncbi:MAG: hypothetical protein M1546_03940 [Chloroflexi bacterium]|nr:hypothetical protein [Chloroflexota bacterium]